ncbi:MarR family transcriptional regulator [Actinomadura sp. NAK00032]|uniref:MarR family transcriptional regulator n=1 Tax=Actinomadura sp. NAK00032 TaxID=2742128 RepID=UPI001590DAA2|nr:MarR family transcriptional regulator [Actinomadura sp. NAK00032]QKW35642.1 MarR family transcriptional regulator [Actinomadura sp. NAK00032]
MSPTASLNPKIVGQAENAHEAVLARALATTDLTKQHWIALTLAATAGEPLGAGALAGRLTSALRSAEPAAAHRILGDLAAGGMLTAEHSVTPAGQELFARVRAETGQVIARAYAGIPAGDLQTAARVLELVTDRLDREAARTGA